MPRSWRPAVLLVAGTAAALFALLRAEALPWLLRATAVAGLPWLAWQVLRELRPGGAPTAIRVLHAGALGDWSIDDASGRHVASLICGIAVGRAGWWLGFKVERRRRWTWVDAAASDPDAYRHLCCRLRERAN